jgi:predicted Zn-dependent protease
MKEETELDEAKEKKPEYDKNKVVNAVQAAMLKSRGNVIAGQAQRAAARLAAKVKHSMKEEVDLDEAVSRKHFQQVADVIKSHPDQKKRNELAKHHADIFKKQNPRFDHGKFYSAAGANINKE